MPSCSASCRLGLRPATLQTSVRQADHMKYSESWVWSKQGLPSGYVKHSYGKSPFSIGKSTISMVIFNSYVKLPEGSPFWGFVSHQQNKYLLEMMFMGIQSVPRSSGRQDHVGQKTSEVLVALRLRCIDSADFAIETDCYVRQTAHARPLQMTALPVLSVHFKDSMYSNLWIEKKKTRWMQWMQFSQLNWQNPFGNTCYWLIHWRRKQAPQPTVSES